MTYYHPLQMNPVLELVIYKYLHDSQILNPNRLY
nr:MAG TPA: hypothetical protein [Caudoviricetes sp.]DAQ45776.1 MAG TPA: hypothetical protein [Caudoviricetes sp.]DAR45768.1 MAG TPA: hypothetical protein [Bacteriophage sp.]DAV84188.1 MAG TPA: hypothetical protein [Caudoviricetes sp.]